MKKTKVSGLFRLIAFLLIATVLLCVFGFSAGGWQSMTNPDINSDNTVIDSGNVDENTAPSDDDLTPEVKYYDRLTGLEVTEEESHVKKTAFVINSSSPAYGLSTGELVIEFPTENGETRLLMYTKAINTLGKIGSIAPTRGFISDMIASFEAILIANGCDDTVDYSSFDTSGKLFDLSVNAGYSYTEYTHFVYSNHDLIKAGLANNSFAVTGGASGTLPYTVSSGCEYKNDGTTSAVSVVLGFSDTKTTELYYSPDDGRYYLYENGSKRYDALYGKDISYKNAFVLFADTVTYESESGSEMIINTKNGGSGYYISCGVAKELLWENVNGSLRFKDINGEVLTVAAGESYIGFLKSSSKSSLTVA